MENTARNLRFCLFCKKEIHGRMDKKYCNDFCRSNYNNRHISPNLFIVRKTNNILKRNRRILEILLENKKGICRVSVQKMVEMGFQFRFLTNKPIDENEQNWVSCYDYSWKLENKKWCRIKMADDLI